MPVSKPEKAMKKALNNASKTTADYLDSAPGRNQNAEETHDKTVHEVDNQAFKKSDAAGPTEESGISPQLKEKLKHRSLGDLLSKN